MARGRYRKNNYDSTGTTVESVTTYTCDTSGLSLQNINSSLFNFEFLTRDSESGVLGCIDLMLDKLEVYITNVTSYDVDGKNNYSEAYDELVEDVRNLSTALTSLKQELETKVSDIEKEIKDNYVWAYQATLSERTDEVV
jgi:hypothetical protein